ncbi:MAG: hypothetical protein JWM47_4547 [Acidimicrobiales bacterium]|nr:hypothetical protein [Acidimicrobiales bacterium]
MTDFMRVLVTSDATQLADDAIARLQVQWPGWDPNQADLEVVQIEALAPMAQNAADVAARVPGLIFRKLGTDIYGVAYQDGVPASGTVTIDLTDTVGHTIPAGFQIDIDGYVFATDTDATVLPGDDVAASVSVAAVDPGTGANGLTGVSVAALGGLDWVGEITLDAATSGGEDAEDDSDYNDRFARRLRLQARTLITLRDHELFALDYPGVGRAFAYKPDPDAPRDITIVLADDVAGDPVDSPLKATILADMTDDTTTRRVNSSVTLDDADYTTINVAWTAAFYTGNIAADVIDRVNAALTDFLSPLNWGRPVGSLYGSPADRWVNDPVVRYEKVIGVIEAVAGVDYLATLSLNSGAEGVDVTMTGTVALPQPGTITGAQA